MSNVAIGNVLEREVTLRANESGAFAIKQHVESKFDKGGNLICTGGGYGDFVLIFKARVCHFDTKSTKNKNKLGIAAGFKGKSLRRKYQQFLKLQDASYHCPAFYLVYWSTHGTYEIFYVNDQSIWPYICIRGLGVGLGSNADWFENMIKVMCERWRKFI